MADEKQEASKSGDAPKIEIKDEIVETLHSVVVGGKRIDYKALTGTLALKDDTGKAKAAIFFIAYF